jgi:hypothetical protein
MGVRSAGDAAILRAGLSEGTGQRVAPIDASDRAQ